MKDELRFVVSADDAGRVDRAVARHFPETGRRGLAALFAAGAVRIAGKIARKGDRVTAGAEITLVHAPASGEDLRPSPDPDAADRLIVLHVDDDVVAVAKPAGMPSQPLRAGERGTAANGLVVGYPECAGVSDDPRDGGLVHRLDIGTSGVLLAARTRAAWLALRSAFSSGQIDKEYLALTWGAPVATSCDAPLAQRGKAVVVDASDGLAAHTEWTIERVLGPWRLVRCRATTGRMHQVRAHLAHCGAPIAGDTLYGGPALPGLIGFFLHAKAIGFPRGPLPPALSAAPPSAGRGDRVTVHAPLPADRQGALDQLSG